MDPVFEVTSSPDSHVVFHSVSMTLLLFIAVPFLTISSSNKSYPSNPTKSNGNQCRWTVAQITCSGLLVSIGGYAFYEFNDYRSVHAIFGLIIITLLVPIWTISQLEVSPFNLDRFPLMATVRKWICIVMTMLVFPTQWMLGLHRICRDSVLVRKRWGYFIGHYFPGYNFMAGGIAIIWYCTEMEMILQGEIYVMGSAGLLTLIGELIRDFNPENPHFWHHAMMDGMGVILPVLCFVFYKLKVPRRKLLHGLCMTFFWGTFGRMMLMHQTDGSLRETMHQLVGVLSIGTAIARMGCVFWDKLTMIYGYLSFAVGIFLNFASPQMTRYWQRKEYLGYPANTYVMIVMVLYFYFSSIASTAKQVIQHGDIKEVETFDKHKDAVDKERLLMDADVEALCTEMV